MGRAPCCDKANVKKGPWSPEEDAKLKSFIEQNGTGGNWITLPSKAGLKRCGKSCRLRWINYLRPDIKHGSFTEEEERTIYRFHSQIGSRWSQIAAQLPGRTDNDIKNFWNTRLKKKLLERGNPAAHYGYGRFHPYQHAQQIPVHLVNQMQMASAAAREGLLHGQHSYPLYQQQMQHQHQLALPTLLHAQHQMNLSRCIKNEMVNGDQDHQQPPLVTPTNGPVDKAGSERLRDIESSLWSCFVPDEAATGGGGGSSRKLPASISFGDPAASTSILDPQPQNPCAAPGSLLPAPRFNDRRSLGQDLGVYEDLATGADRDSQAGGLGDWWNIDLVSPPRHNPTFDSSSSRASSVKWPVQPPRYSDTFFGKLVV